MKCSPVPEVPGTREKEKRKKFSRKSGKGTKYIIQQVTIQDQCVKNNESSCLHVRDIAFHTLEPNRVSHPI